MLRDNIEEVKERHAAWWAGKSIKRPLIHLIAKREGVGEIQTELFDDYRDSYLNVQKIIANYLSYKASHTYDYGDSIPMRHISLGAGSLALYLGSEPEFSDGTIWFKECIEDIENYPPLVFDPENKWWKLHLQMLEEAVALARGEIMIPVPDLIENIDIFAAMRGPQNTCYDIVDYPERVAKFILDIDNCYFDHYDKMYDIVKESDGWSCEHFNVFGPGKMGKVQCDFSAMMSPDSFEELIVPSLKKQCAGFNNSIYHLDGRAATRHLDALMTVDELTAMQFTAGAGEVCSGDSEWYFIYDKIREHGKSLYVGLDYTSNIRQTVSYADALVKRYGSDGLYLLFPEMEESLAREIKEHADTVWSVK